MNEHLLGLIFAIMVVIVIYFLVWFFIEAVTSDHKGLDGSGKIKQNQGATLEELIERNRDLIIEFTEKIKKVPIKFFRVSEAFKTFENSPGISYSKTEIDRWHKMYPELYAYGDLIRDYLIQIASHEKREDISPLNGELIPQWIPRIEKNPPADWCVWKDLHMHLFFLSEEINENLHDERDKNIEEERKVKERIENEQTLERLDVFYLENTVIIKKFFEILKKKAISIDDYGDKIFNEDIFNDELQVFFGKIADQLKSEDNNGYPEIKHKIGLYLWERFQNDIR